ncbi:hypothetical protein A4H97_16490 [Niastella yeongjuensis]|uniref:Virulence factor SrfB n=1 Tax=Niastella yeongjuensis TaxID=354355 RepID=A0A1V9E167_9BACT|nr:virulence factor SrfB [Niastella yeongjuensis]OQP39819.1 hypothetical protein A4H97_16490 [Niastella yeongjuensis]SEO06552.1 hypothetical protein SAMN05660816_02045 [Niastella yeongjuensis]
MISLIANTGIQFHTEKILIDTGDGRGKMYFYEWFDSTENKLKLELAHYYANDDVWVRKKELFTYGYLKDGKVTDEWDVVRREIQEISKSNGVNFNMSLNKCKIENFENTWLPFPYFELNKQNNSVFGPTNWCRIKLIPTAASIAGKREYQVVFAFDTRAFYEDGNYEDEFRETPVFASEFESAKSYAPCKSEFMLIDFCSENYNCEWVNEYILRIYHHTDNIAAITPPKFVYMASYVFLVNYIRQNCNFPIVNLYKDRNVQWCTADLALDIGNSKTSAVLFDEGDFTRVRPLELQDFSNPVTKYHEPFDMRLAFHKARFGDINMLESKQFIYPSIVRLGKEANNLLYSTINENNGQEKVTTFSSPKRYLWDKRQHGFEWEPVQLKGEEKESIWLNGLSQQLNSDGSINKEGNGGRNSSYSRNSLMTLSFVEILAQARMQINSFRYRDEMGNADKPRKINRIIITCPTAMSKMEQISLRKCAEEAAIILDRFIANTYNAPFEYKELASKINIIPSVKSLSNKEESLEWTYDEATCSQFVFLYAEISKRYLNNCKEYFELYGKVRKDLPGYNQKSLTIGSFDIGAGTSDLMICSYENTNAAQTTLKPIPLFWESFYYAGDDLLQEFVRQFIIEGPHGAVKNKLIEMGKGDSASALLFDFFGMNHSSMTARDRQHRSDFNLQVSLPIALKLLELVQQHIKTKDLTFDEVFATGNYPSETILTHFEKHFGFSIKSIKWNYNIDDANLIIVKTFEPLIKKVTALMYAYKCDFVLLAGRPTSLKKVEELFQKNFPVPPNRLITLNNYRIGRWYPFQDGNGYFKNQKSIVTIGAMIGNIASDQGGLSGFSLDLSALREKMRSTADYIGIINEKTKRIDAAILSPNLHYSSIVVSGLPVTLGCRQLNTEAYPTRAFYVLDFNDEFMERKFKKNGITNIRQLKEMVESEKLKIRRQMPLNMKIAREDYALDKETLSLESVYDNNNNEFPSGYFTLQIQSLSEPENFWLDTGEFILDIKTRP